MSMVPNFSAAFDYSAEKVATLILEGNSSSIDLWSDEDTLKELRKKIEADGIRIDGDERLLGLGSMSVVAHAASTKSGQAVEMKNAIARLEYMQTKFHDIALRPAFEKKYSETTTLGDNYKLYFVPNAPDHPGEPVTDDDIKRTIQVLKATGDDHHFWDFQPTALVFLKNDNGDFIRYPDTGVPDDFKGKKIAFIRDINALDATLEKQADHNRINTWLKAKGLKDGSGQLIDYEHLPPAPQVCVDACKQQYLLTEKLHESLREDGIEPNIPLPEMPWTAQFPQGTKSTRTRANPD